MSDCQVHVKNIWDFCDLCPNKTNINWKCVQCQQFLCEVCYNSHTKGRITKDHVVFTKDEKDKEPELLELYICKKHKDSNITMYCTDDEVPICAKCITKEHRGHNIDELGTAADKMRGELREEIAKCNKRKSSLDEITGAEKCMTDYTTRSIKEIKEITTKLMDNLPQVSISLIKDFELERQNMIQDFAEMKAEFSLDIHCVDDHFADVDHGVNSFRDGEIIRKGQQMLQKIKLKTTIRDMGYRKKYMELPATNKQELTQKLVEKCFSATGDDRQSITPDGTVDLSANEYVTCVYIGSDKTSVSLHCINHTFQPTMPHFFSPQWTSGNFKVNHTGNLHNSKYMEEDLCCTLQPVLRKGEVIFKSIDGKEVNGRRMFGAIFEELMSKMGILNYNFWERKRFEHVLVVYSEKIHDNSQSLCNGLKTHQVRGIPLCSDAQAFVDVFSSKPDNTAATQWIVVQMGYATTISAHGDDGRQSLYTPVVCSGLMEIGDRLIYILKSILGKSKSSSKLDTDIFKHQLYKELVQTKPYKKDIGININISSIDRECQSSLAKSRKTSVYERDVSFYSSYMTLSKRLFKQQFEEVSKVICSNISYVLSLMDTRTLPFLLLVDEHGKFNDTTDIIKSTFPSLEVRETGSDDLINCIDAKIKKMCLKS